MIPNCDDERKAMFGNIGFIKLRKGFSLGIGKRVQSGDCLFGGAFGRKPLCLCQLAGQIWVSRQHPELLGR